MVLFIADDNLADHAEPKLMLQSNIRLSALHLRGTCGSVADCSCSVSMGLSSMIDPFAGALDRGSLVSLVIIGANVRIGLPEG